MRENLGNSRKASNFFFISFPACPPTFHKTNVLHSDLKKDAVKKFGIKDWISNAVFDKFQEHRSFLLRHYWRMITGEKIGTCKDSDRVTKTFGGKRVISMKPGRKSQPLCLVWWSLVTFVLRNYSSTHFQTREIFSFFYMWSINCSSVFDWGFCNECLGNITFRKSFFELTVVSSS